MATVKPLDPIQGFVDFIEDIKPYHTKIAEVLIEYQHEDLVDITILENLEFDIDLFRPDAKPNVLVCSGGYDTFPYGGSSTGHTIISVDAALDTFTIPGDVSDLFLPGSQVSVFSQVVDALSTVIVDGAENTGIFTVLSSTFVPGVNPSTVITVVEDVVDPPILPPNQFYVISMQAAPIDIVDEIPYSNIENRPFEEPDESQLDDIGANAFVVDGDFTERFTQGVEFRVNTGKNIGTYNTLYSDFVSGQTRIRVLEDIKHISSIKGTPGGGQIVEPPLGYAPTSFVCSSVPPETIQAGIVDSLVFDSIAFDWGSTEFFDIIAVDETAETITLSGDFSSILFPTDKVFIVGSDVNDDEYEIVSVSFDSGANETTIELTPGLDASSTFGQLRVDLLDVVEWFQYNIIDTNPNEFIVFGNATQHLFPGQQFRVLGNPGNGGIYTALTVVSDGTRTTVTVSDTLVSDVIGGVIESHRDQGINIRFNDTVATDVTEEAAAALVTTGGSPIGGWDFTFWDVGVWDDNASVLIDLYGSTFTP